MTLLSKAGGFIQSHFKIAQAFPPLIHVARTAFKIINRKNLIGIKDKVTKPATTPEKFKLLVVVPPSWSATNKGWGPGIGHYYYDIWKSAQERYGSKSVDYIELESDRTNWSEFLLDRITQSKPTHIIFHAEEIPYGDFGQLLKFGKGLNSCFSGAFVLLMYDSIYWNHLFIAEAMKQVFDGTCILATDQFPRLAKVWAKTGPALLPTSLESVRTLDSNYSKETHSQRFGTTIIGSVYGYRERKLRRLSKIGLNVEINPHKKPNSMTKPSYLDYYSVLRDSKFTINFSRANGARVKHAKTRLLEATLFGTIVATDERKITSLLLKESEHIYFRNLRHLMNQIHHLNENPMEYQSLLNRSADGGERLRIAFWIAFEDLCALHFPELPAAKQLATERSSVETGFIV
jgi:hypothetical protein